ncbi:MAG: D-alanyl-D-alanine carboxypeptidase family protein [Litorivicinus sp.]
MRKCFLSLLVFAGFAQAATIAVPTPDTVIAPIASPPTMAVSSYLLVDGATGQVLAESNSQEQVEPASLTKLMTAYLAEKELKAGNISMDDEVPVSVKAWKTEGSRMFIREGTQVRLEDLLRGIIIQSGNDASVAMAEYLAGTEEAFAELMTAQAKALGMEQTQFYNSTGLPAPGHLTSARDLAILARQIIYEHPELYRIYSEKSFTYNDIKQDNRNRLLWRDPSVDGLKTGHTSAAGYCLVASAERGGMRLISVVMGADSAAARERETSKLLNYGYRFFEGVTLFKANQDLNQDLRVWGGEVDTVAIGPASEVYRALPKGARDRLELTLDAEPDLSAPIAKGQQLGTLTVTLDGETLTQVPVVALADVADGGLVKRAMDWVLKAME